MERKRQKLMNLMKSIIEGLRSSLKDGKKKQGLIDLFNNAPKQKVPYGELYDYFDNVLQINTVESEYE